MLRGIDHENWITSAANCFLLAEDDWSVPTDGGNIPVATGGGTCNLRPSGAAACNARDHPGIERLLSTGASTAKSAACPPDEGCCPDRTAVPPASRQRHKWRRQESNRDTPPPILQPSLGSRHKPSLDSRHKPSPSKYCRR